MDVGGFDTKIEGWGKEDVDLFEKVIHKTRNANSKNRKHPLFSVSKEWSVKPTKIFFYV